MSGASAALSASEGPAPGHGGGGGGGQGEPASGKTIPKKDTATHHVTAIAESIADADGFVGDASLCSFELYIHQTVYTVFYCIYTSVNAFVVYAYAVSFQVDGECAWEA